MSATRAGQRGAVPMVTAAIDLHTAQLSECIQHAGVARLSDGDIEVGIVFAPAAFEEFRAEIEELELQLRAWKSELQRLDGQLIPHEQIERKTERLVAGE